MCSDTYDYIIIGSGASGLQLALAMQRDSYFRDKQIAIIEKRKEFSNDKTWCFWEKKIGLYDNILFKSWNQTRFTACGETLQISLNPYFYKMIRSVDFYSYAKKIIFKTNNIKWIQDDINSVLKKNNKVIVKGSKKKYLAKHVFDSRPPKNLFTTNSVNILQHFKGWFIKTDTNVFKPSEFCMMDFSIADKKKTCFMYILPFNEQEALLEFTYFSSKKENNSVYEYYLQQYLSKKLNNTKYVIVEEENGVIPMTSFPFYKQSTKRITKIGTSGGWVKASTGYSFKNAEKMAANIVSNIKKGETPHYNLFKKRFKHYDKLFLSVLKNHNDYGEKLFFKMYKGNNIKRIFRFLDEESNIIEEILIMFKLRNKYFIKALLTHLLQGSKIK